MRRKPLWRAVKGASSRGNRCASLPSKSNSMAVRALLPSKERPAELACKSATRGSRADEGVRPTLRPRHNSFPALLLVDQGFDFVGEVEAGFGDLGVQFHGVDGDGEFLASYALADLVRHQEVAFLAVVAGEGIGRHFPPGGLRDERNLGQQGATVVVASG